MLRPWEVEIEWNQNDAQALYMQIADYFIEVIKNGKLKSGDALPGSRPLAESLKVNRNTVVKALDVLLAEGWLISKERKGTFVAEVLPEEEHFTTLKRNIEVPEESVQKATLVFDDGVPDSRLAPMTELVRAYRQIFNRKARWQLMGYANALGDLEFRNAMVQMLNFKRSMSIAAHEICITRGSQMAMYLTAHCLLKKGDVVLVESPGYKPAWKALESAGATLIPIAVDKEGLVIQEVITALQQHKGIKAIYVTPHHQYPTTVTMSLQRRQQLIELSNKHVFTIIEDDYDNEFHFGYRPILPISSHANIQNYVYLGTLSKIVAPALRIGYLVSNPEFIEKISQLRKIIDVQGDTIMEQAVLHLIQEGGVKRHLKKATAIYKHRRDYFGKLLQEHLKEKVIYTKPEGGLAYWIVPNATVDVLQIADELEKRGIMIIKSDKFSFDTPVKGFRLGYASLTEDQMKEGIMALAGLL